MKVSETYYDEIFDFSGQWDMPSKCGLMIRHRDGRDVVIVTELYQENPGTSVTYAGESLFNQICAAKGLDPARVQYIECNPDTNSKLSFYDEELYEVDFTAVDPAKRYRRLSVEEVKEIRQ